MKTGSIFNPSTTPNGYLLATLTYWGDQLQAFIAGGIRRVWPGGMCRIMVIGAFAGGERVLVWLKSGPGFGTD